MNSMDKLVAKYWDEIEASETARTAEGRERMGATDWLMLFHREEFDAAMAEDDARE